MEVLGIEERPMSAPGPNSLVLLDQAARLLAEATSIEDIREVHDTAEAARAYAKAAKLGLDAQNRAAEVKLRAERKAGEFLRAIKLRGGDHRSKGQRVRLKLEDLGISRQQSKRWQLVASVNEADFCDYLRCANELEHEVTAAGLLRIARKARPPTDKGPLTLRRRRPKRATISEATTPLDELLREITNHRQLLEDILRPVYEEFGVELPRGEKRLVGRLLREMRDQINQLTEMLGEFQITSLGAFLPLLFSV
jgi:hypothetical protein